LRSVETTIRNAFGQTLSVAGQAEKARRQHETALRLATLTAEPYERALALGGLAACAQTESQADRWHAEALEVVESFGLTDKDSAHLRRRLEMRSGVGLP
jgi:hypothetical protein